MKGFAVFNLRLAIEKSFIRFTCLQIENGQSKIETALHL